MRGDRCVFALIKFGVIAVVAFESLAVVGLGSVAVVSALALFGSLALTGSLAYAGDLSLISAPQKDVLGHIGSLTLLAVSVRSESGQPLIYEWKKNGKILPGETSNMLQIQHAKLGDAGTYEVHVRGAVAGSGAALSASSSVGVGAGAGAATIGSAAAVEEITAITEVKISKEKLKVDKRKPAAPPVAASCHEMAPAADPKAAAHAPAGAHSAHEHHPEHH